MVYTKSMEDIEQKINTPSFNDQLNVIAEKVQQEREHATEQGSERTAAAEREQIRNELRKIQEEDNKATQTKKTATAAAAAPDHTQYEEYLNTIDTQYREQVAELVKHATEDGIPAAVKKAQQKNDPYLMDTFHDALTLYCHKKMQDNKLL